MQAANLYNNEGIVVVWAVPFKKKRTIGTTLLICCIDIHNRYIIKIIQIIAILYEKAFDNTCDKIACDGAQTRALAKRTTRRRANTDPHTVALVVLVAE